MKKLSLCLIPLAFAAGCAREPCLEDESGPVIRLDHGLETCNARPVAEAGISIDKRLIELDATNSSDRNGDELTYTWKIVSLPTGSRAVLEGEDTASASLIADEFGAYTFELIVSDGELSSAPKQTAIVWQNQAPVPNTGVAELDVELGVLVTLDGSGSVDPEGAPVTYSWRMIDQPATSSAALSQTTMAQTSFTPFARGAYNIGLTVSDGLLSSAEAVIRVRAGDTGLPPTADAGEDLEGTVGEPVLLSGRNSSDPEGGPLSYRWQITDAPSGAEPNIVNGDRSNAEYVPTKAGYYTLRLTVDDGAFIDADELELTVWPQLRGPEIFNPDEVYVLGATQDAMANRGVIFHPATPEVQTVGFSNVYVNGYMTIRPNDGRIVYMRDQAPKIMLFKADLRVPGAGPNSPTGYPSNPQDNDEPFLDLCQTQPFWLYVRPSGRIAYLCELESAIYDESGVDIRPNAGYFPIAIMSDDTMLMIDRIVTGTTTHDLDLPFGDEPTIARITPDEDAFMTATFDGTATRLYHITRRGVGTLMGTYIEHPEIVTSASQTVLDRNYNIYHIQYIPHGVVMRRSLSEPAAIFYDEAVESPPAYIFQSKLVTGP